MLENINPYDKNSWETSFKKTELYKKISNDFDVVSFEHFVELTYFNNPEITPRQTIGTSIFSGTVFYYIDYLLQDNPDIIYDVGCGWNVFKRYIPVYGIDISPFADSYTIENDKITKYKISINSLHFGKHISNIKDIVVSFLSTIENGGKGFLALNSARMNKGHITGKIEDYIRSELYDLKDHFLVFDLDLTFRDAYLDGNIRMVLSK